MAHYKPDQGELAYIYSRAQSHAESHPDVADKHKKTIQNFPHFKNESDAINAALNIERQNRTGAQVWAKIGKNEEYYYIQDYFIASDDSLILTAAEYIGMAQVFTT